MLPTILVCPRCYNPLSPSRKFPCKRTCPGRTCRKQWKVELRGDPPVPAYTPVLDAPTPL